MTDHYFSDSDLTELLHRSGIRPSVQRVAILSFVASGTRHLSAEEIFTELSGRFPTMSRTTVYNSLHVLAGAGLLRELEFDSNNRRYDFAPRPDHAHFQCRRCGRIFDMPLPAAFKGLDSAGGFNIDAVDVTFRGICPECAG